MKCKRCGGELKKMVCGGFYYCSECDLCIEEEKIMCPRYHTPKTRKECLSCDFSNLGDCYEGAFFAWNPENRHVYEDLMVKSQL